MTKLFYIISILILFNLSLYLYADNNQYSSRLTITDDVNGVAQFMIFRESYFSTEYFSVESTLSDLYVAKGFYVDDDYSYDDTAEYTYSGNGNSTDILSIKSYSYSGDDDLISLLDKRKGINLQDNAGELGFYLINCYEPSLSYEIVISIEPTIEITPESFTDTEELLESLNTEPSYRNYLKKQVLGSNFFTPTDENPFPLMEIDNEYTYRISLDENFYLSRDSETTNYNYFDVIYNRAENRSDELGGSLIQNLFSIYFNNNKPLFHHYINEYMESSGNDFNYRDYRMITYEEGEELINRALTYLTWGVEHTSDQNYNTLDGGGVYPSQVLNSNSSIREWLSTPGIESNRTKNYLTYTPKDIRETYNEDDISYRQEMVDQLKDIAGEYFTFGNTKMDGIGLTTPFYSGYSPITGASLPYVKGGMDSPRTFNYKMMKQYDLIEIFLNSRSQEGVKTWYGIKDGSSWKQNDYLFSVTSMNENHTRDDYYRFARNNDDGESLETFPFVPGYDGDEEYNYMNLTGVDSLGLLSGALAMTSYYDEVLALTNDRKFVDLDHYYSMSLEDGEPKSPFLQNSGEPNFHRTDFNDTYQTNYSKLRFNRMDIERSSVIVPNLKDIQPGDLLVNNKGGETEVALVVDSGYNEGDSIFHLSNVLVLSVNEIDGRVTLNSWGNGATYSSFTDRPKDFIVRRLIKFDGEDIDNREEFGEDDEWDPFSSSNMNVETHLKYDSDDNYNCWIPNTGEMFIINSITFSSDNSELNFDDIPVLISGLTDINYSTEDSLINNSTTGSNININRGDGFEFYAIISDDDDKDFIKLATFNINTNSQNAQDRYLVEYESNIFNSDGSSKDGFELVTDADTLFFYYQQGPSRNSEKRTKQFGIRPLENNIRPGDDIILNFDLDIENHIVSAPGIESEALGVYDKMMLWRANLYIDEGSSDWNNSNPWNAPANGSLPTTTYNLGNYTATFKTFFGPNSELIEDTGVKVYYGFNEWNKIYDGTIRLMDNKNEPLESEYLTDLSDDGLGKQVVTILPFTYHTEVDGATDKNVSNVVSYAYGCNDNPFEFNDEMRQQSSFFADYFNVDKKRFLKPKGTWPEDGINSLAEYEEYVAEYDKEDDEYPEDIISLDGYTGDSTTAFKKKWENYITPFEVLSTSSNSYTETSNLSNIIQSYSTSDSFPFLPGYALYHFKKYNAEPPDWANAISAGVDCIGFVSRIASYTDNSYTWEDVESQTIHNTNRHFVDVNYPTYGGGDSVYITDSDNLNDDETAILDLEKVKPGDLMYYIGSNGSHITMVLDVEDINSDGIISLGEVSLIESTWSEQREIVFWASVTNINTLSSYSGTEWNIVRLKEE